VVSWDKNGAQGKVLRIDGAGTLTTNPGWAVKSVTLKASPVKGGLLRSAVATTKDRSWSADLKTVPAGTYNVWTEMVIENPQGTGKRSCRHSSERPFPTILT
jgi:hypothetical protein